MPPLIVERFAAGVSSKSVIFNVPLFVTFLPFIIGLSNIFGIQTMLTFNYKKAFTRIIVIGSVLNIILALILVPLWKHIGISIAMLITEIFITTTMYLYLKNKGII